MKIYAVTKGDYSDSYHICGLTTNKNKAKKMKEIYSDKYEEAAIEIYNDDETKEEPEILWYYDDLTKKVTMDEYHLYLSSEEIQETNSDETQGRPVISGAYVYAENAELAKEKAQEIIAAAKARREGLL